MFLFGLIMFNIKDFRHPQKKFAKKIMGQFIKTGYGTNQHKKIFINN